eukprot:sb/3470927/
MKCFSRGSRSSLEATAPIFFSFHSRSVEGAIPELCEKFLVLLPELCEIFLVFLPELCEKFLVFLILQITQLVQIHLFRFLAAHLFPYRIIHHLLDHLLRELWLLFRLREGKSRNGNYKMAERASRDPRENQREKDRESQKEINKIDNDIMVLNQINLTEIGITPTPQFISLGVTKGTQSPIVSLRCYYEPLRYV